MSDFFEFISLAHPNVRYVVIGSILITSASAIIGCYTLLRKRALIGDAVAHSLLPGVALAFMLSGEKNPLWLLLGAFGTGWLSLILVDLISGKTRIREDASIALILSVFFAIGSLLLSVIQNSGNAAQAGLNTFLFGHAASILPADMVIFGITGFLLLLCVTLFYKEFFMVSFDKDYAASQGFPVRLIELILSTLTVLAVVVGIQAVGVVLMAAMLITPAAAARYWTEKLMIMLLLSAAFGAFSGVAGAYISYGPDQPTGPWIVIVASTIAVLSLLLAPKKGLVARIMLHRENKNRILEENLLKIFYHLGEREEDFFEARSKDELLRHRSMTSAQLNKGLKRLTWQGFLKKAGESWQLSPEGKQKGQRVVRLHRLWELFLTTYMRIAPDHVHQDAETIEHIITPEIEHKLEVLLGHPGIDPHESKIPEKE